MGCDDRAGARTSMKAKESSIDWARVVIHGVIGIVVGGILGLLIGYAGQEFSWKMVIVPGLILGVLGALFGDRFWEWLCEFMRWW